MKSQAQWDTFIKYVTAGCTITDAATMANMERTTAYERMKRDAPFKKQVEKAQLAPTIHAITLVQTAMQKQWTAAAWWLERTQPERFGNKEKVDITSGGRSIVDVMRAALRRRDSRVEKGDVRRPGMVLDRGFGDKPVVETDRDHPKH